MIAPTKRPRTMSRVLGVNGQPLPLPVNRKPRTDLAPGDMHRTSRRQNVEATYDAASSSSEFANYWANADVNDADSGNSRAVRSRLVSRSRYETQNNGFADGIVQTLATDIVGVGPSLRMQTSSKGFNQAVEAIWSQWAKRIQLRRKLWTMAHAKVQDGEALAIVRTNPKVRHPVKLDMMLIETEQCQSLFQQNWTYGYIDGMKFDEFGNVEYYDILPAHPGGLFNWMSFQKPEQVDPKYVLHWFLQRRPGQHRGVPEFRSTLQVGAASRRWREATIASAETAADISVWMNTTMLPQSTDGADEIVPMSQLSWEKRMAVAAPMGWTPTQMKSEHPNATYGEFHKSQINELARPKSMPYNKAACDSSSGNFASGRLDHITYYGSLDVEREDADDTTLEKLFELFWEEAVLVYGWLADGQNPPAHKFDWPKHPVADVSTEASANDIKLKNGSLTLSQLYAEDGRDFEDELTQMAEDYGVDEATMRETLHTAIFNDKNQQASQQQADNTAPTATSDSTSKTASADAVTDQNIQATALNGAQILAMAQVVQNQSEGRLPVESARAILQAVFPQMDKTLINKIVDGIAAAPAQTADTEQVPAETAA